MTRPTLSRPTAPALTTLLVVAGLVVCGSSAEGQQSDSDAFAPRPGERVRRTHTARLGL